MSDIVEWLVKTADGQLVTSQWYDNVDEPDSASLELSKEAELEAERLREAAAEITRLRSQLERAVDALLWIDTYDPETVAAAETKFGFNLKELKAAPDSKIEDY